MRLGELASATGRTFGSAFDGIKRFAKLERVLAGLCLGIPLLLVGFDSWSLRPSISDYYDMAQNQVFYFSLTVAALLFIFNGTIKEERAYNTLLGVFLAFVVLLNHDDFKQIHGIFATAFFAGNAVFISRFAKKIPRHFRFSLLAVIAVAILGWKPFGWYSLFWAEWMSFFAIGVHFIRDSLQQSEERAAAA